MKVSHAFALALFATPAGFQPATLAGERTRPTPLPAALVESSLSGLQISLTTSGYKFLLPAGGTAPAQRGQREGFVASALVANRSNTDIAFTFPTPVAAQTKWTFRIYDSKGVQLWQSDAEVVSPQVLAEAVLEKRARWKRLIQVPLQIDGRPLAPGLYTLEASIDADKPLSATALFEVGVLPAVR